MNRRVAYLSDGFTSHVLPFVGLARRFERAGFEAEVWGSDKAVAVARQQGLVALEVAGIVSRVPSQLYHRTDRLLQVPRYALSELRARRQFATELPGRLAASATALTELAAERKPALVVYDPFLLAWSPILREQGVPGAVLPPTPLVSPDPAVPPLSSGVVPRSGRRPGLAVRAAWARRRFQRRALGALASAARGLGAYTHESLLEAVAARAGGIRTEREERFIELDVHFRDMPEWVLTTPELEFPRQSPLPPEVRLIGPCVDFERREPPLPPLTGDPLVYASVGTVEQMSSGDGAFLRNVIAAFADGPPRQLVIGTGNATTTAALQPLPPGVHVADTQPQLALLRRASLAITHGGGGTVRECVALGVPMLVFPRNDDQFGGSARVVFHGLGLRGDRLRCTPAEIRALAERVIGDPAFRAACEHMRTTIDRYERSTDHGALVDEAIAFCRQRWL